MTLEQDIKDKESREFQAGYLIPANGGQEKPIHVMGFNLLYCYHTGNSKHYYLNLDTDIVLSDTEVIAIFNC